MVSDIQLNKEDCLTWVHNLIENFGETEHTNTLLKFAEEQISKSTTFVDFFANIIMELFKDYGLLIVDSGNKEFRMPQKEFLKSKSYTMKRLQTNYWNNKGELAKKVFR